MPSLAFAAKQANASVSLRSHVRDRLAHASGPSAARKLLAQLPQPKENRGSMLTYDLTLRGERPLYEHLYLCIATDISSGILGSQEKLPSKRRLAKHLGVSLVTVEAAYTQLVAEGYVRAVERKGYYVRPDASMPTTAMPRDPSKRVTDARRASQAASMPESSLPIRSSETVGSSQSPDSASSPEPSDLIADFRGTAVAPGLFPYNVWAKSVRGVLATETEQTLVDESQAQGSLRLRQAICRHLHESRGIDAAPDQVVIGAGAQYLYNLIVQLLGRNRTVALEDPGYSRLTKIYQLNNLRVQHVGMDPDGIRMDDLRASGADLVHIMPSHQFPLGLVTQVSRRYELLSWASEDERRIILEDDYDCEFRLAGKPIPALASIDPFGQVIYMGTFTKSLGAGFRIGYVVLPKNLVEDYRSKLGFYSCTVSAVDQLALANFMGSGGYERHVNRLRTHYRTLRDALVQALRASSLQPKVRLHSLDSGLHFLMGVSHEHSETELADAALAAGVALLPLSSFWMDPSVRFSMSEMNQDPEKRWFVMSYTGLDARSIPAVISVLEKVFS